VMVGSRQWDWRKTYVFGVLNITPDSFSDGGACFGANKVARAVDSAMQMVADGADAIDIGGESTRPGSERISEAEELTRVIPVVEALRQRTDIPLSIDTYKASVAKQAVEFGANIVNDISGGLMDDNMFETLAVLNVPVVIGHLRGRPETMQDEISFSDVVQDVGDDLRARLRCAQHAGICNKHLWVDPGIGFGKNADQSLALVAATDQLVADLGRPMMIGVSRKSFIGTVCGLAVDQRIHASIVASCVSACFGAHFLRVHDVAEAVPAVKLVDAVVRHRSEAQNTRQKA